MITEQDVRDAFVAFELAKANANYKGEVKCCLTCKLKRIFKQINVCGRDGLPVKPAMVCDKWQADRETVTPKADLSRPGDVESAFQRAYRESAQ